MKKLLFLWSRFRSQEMALSSYSAAFLNIFKALEQGTRTNSKLCNASNWQTLKWNSKVKLKVIDKKDTKYYWTTKDRKDIQKNISDTNTQERQAKHEATNLSHNFIWLHDVLIFFSCFLASTLMVPTFLYSFAYFVGNILVFSPLNSHRPLASLVPCFKARFLPQYAYPSGKQKTFSTVIGQKYLSFKPRKTGDPKHGTDFWIYMIFFDSSDTMIF